MERPSKRQRLSRSKPTLPTADAQALRAKLKARFEQIFEKYEQNFSGIGDEIDLQTGEIVVDNGHLACMQSEQDIRGDQQPVAESDMNSVNEVLWSDQAFETIEMSPRHATEGPRSNVRNVWTSPITAIPTEKAWRAPDIPGLTNTVPLHTDFSTLVQASETISERSESPDRSIWAIEEPQKNNKLPWTLYEDKLLQRLRTTTSYSFQDLEGFFPDRNSWAIRSRWQTLREEGRVSISAKHPRSDSYLTDLNLTSAASARSRDRAENSMPVHRSRDRGGIASKKIKTMGTKSSKHSQAPRPALRRLSSEPHLSSPADQARRSKIRPSLRSSPMEWDRGVDELQIDEHHKPISSRKSALLNAQSASPLATKRALLLRRLPTPELGDVLGITEKPERLLQMNVSQKPSLVLGTLVQERRIMEPRQSQSTKTVMDVVGCEDSVPEITGTSNSLDLPITTTSSREGACQEAKNLSSHGISSRRGVAGVQSQAKQKQGPEPQASSQVPKNRYPVQSPQTPLAPTADESHLISSTKSLALGTKLLEDRMPGTGRKQAKTSNKRRSLQGQISQMPVTPRLHKAKAPQIDHSPGTPLLSFIDENLARENESADGGRSERVPNSLHDRSSAMVVGEGDASSGCHHVAGSKRFAFCLRCVGDDDE